MISTNNRRNLFQGILGLMVEKKAGNSLAEKDLAETTNVEEIVIGRLRDYPLGETKKLASYPLLVETLPEGIRVQSCSNPEKFFSVKLNQQGELIVNFKKTWPANMVFSMMTNEPVCLNNN